jgi:Ca2+-binding RTX toxin-like protein
MGVRTFNALSVMRCLAVIGFSATLMSCTASNEAGSDPADAVTTPSGESAAHAGTEEHGVRGTNGDDVLVGTLGRDIIDGRRGTDLIRGRAGDDELIDYTGVGTGRRLDTTRDVFHGGAGDDLIRSSRHDHVYAGSGHDRVYANYVRPGDVIACGPGRDVVALNDEDPGLALTGCERVRIMYAG